ncbi:metallophosphoesterase [Halegenticoccus tardaugens]|uniref:metallophosphoesterase n=1 Tax=Halegenticoccus tardaugens TaxID=2071624 RepID=UPI00100B5A44|nr:metallophosphoesterase [Halegenticoccus tardaugens]
MLTVVSDTHGKESHRLTGRTLDAVRDAELVIHAGDFTTETVLDAFYEEAAALRAVYGNNDDAATRRRVPESRTVEYGGVRFAVTHTRHGGPTALSLFGRERDADVVVFGHSHRPAFDATGPIPLVNPGSHAEPRGYRAAHVEIEQIEGGVGGRFCTPGGEVFERFELPADG